MPPAPVRSPPQDKTKEQVLNLLSDAPSELVVRASATRSYPLDANRCGANGAAPEAELCRGPKRKMGLVPRNE